MGSGIVKNLLNSGHNVTVWNRTTEKVRSELVPIGLSCSDPDSIGLLPDPYRKLFFVNQDAPFIMLKEFVSLHLSYKIAEFARHIKVDIWTCRCIIPFPLLRD